MNAGTAFANQSCDHQQSVKCEKTRLCSSGKGLREFGPAYVNNPGETKMPTLKTKTTVPLPSGADSVPGIHIRPWFYTK